MTYGFHAQMSRSDAAFRPMRRTLRHAMLARPASSGRVAMQRKALFHNADAAGHLAVLLVLQRSGRRRVG
jgi:hypothetical protein